MTEPLNIANAIYFCLNTLASNTSFWQYIQRRIVEFNKCIAFASSINLSELVHGSVFGVVGIRDASRATRSAGVQFKLWCVAAGAADICIAAPCD